MKLRHVLKKRSIRIAAIVSVIVLAFVAVGALWYFGTGGQKLIVSPESTDVVNYNNYTGSNAEGGSTMDYKNGRFAWLSDGRWTSMLTVADEKRQHQKFLLRLSSFQLLDDRVIYIDYDNNWALTAFDLNTRKTAVLHKDVESFLVYEKQIVFALDRVDFYEDDSFINDNSLLVYDTETKKTKTILDNPKDFYSYYVCNQELFVFTRENLLMKFDWQGEVIEEIEIEGVRSNQVIPSGEYLLYRDDGDLCLYHKKTKEKTVLYFGESPYNVDLNTVAADDENIFVSVQRRKPEGLSENNIEHEDNGLWRVDPETLEYKKVLSDVFYELFLVDGMLFGRKGDQIYRIDIKTFATEPMLG